MTTNALTSLYRLARTAILWPINFATSTLYDYGLKTIESLLATTEAFDNLAAASRNTMRSYTPDDYQRASDVIQRTEPIRTSPWLDYDEELGAPPAMQRTYTDGSTSVINPDGYDYYHPDGTLTVHIGQSHNDEEDAGYAR